ncbi:hypothetical protein PQX77_014417, partial [Marasmius sp. AFHP31]
EADNELAPETHEAAHRQFYNGATTTSDPHLVVSPFMIEHSKLNTREHARESPKRENSRHGPLQFAPIRRPASPPSSSSDRSSDDSDQGTSSVNDLVAELRALRIQQSRLQERTWGQDDGPPPEYYSAHSAGSEQVARRQGKDRVR